MRGQLASYKLCQMRGQLLKRRVSSDKRTGREMPRHSLRGLNYLIVHFPYICLVSLLVETLPQISVVAIVPLNYHKLRSNSFSVIIIQFYNVSV